ncbi:MAG: hypothetical protein AB1540_05095 [Bdellovibrionota bacterium]
MIYVNQKQLDQVEYLIEQSSRGHHVLFETDVIRKVFARKALVDDESDDETESVEKHIENLILQPTLVSKRAYLENLNSETYERVVRTYFAIVENNIFEGMEFEQ